ncbi:MAG: flavin reductase [Treponema sp.]
MSDFKEKDYKVFEMFDKQWAIVTAGSIEHFNSCTVSWGSLGNIWGGEGKSCPIVTVYVHPARYTSEFLKNSDTFTIGFYSETYRRALTYMGSHSGRSEDKAKAAGLTPLVIGDGVTYKEANLTFLCRKLYQHSFSSEDLAPKIREYYASMPEIYPDFKGGWQPHIVFIGEIISVEDKR